MDDDIATVKLTVDDPSNDDDDQPIFVNKKKGGGEGEDKLRFAAQDRRHWHQLAVRPSRSADLWLGWQRHDDQGVTSTTRTRRRQPPRGHAACLTVVDNAVETVVARRLTSTPTTANSRLTAGRWAPGASRRSRLRTATC